MKIDRRNETSQQAELRRLEKAVRVAANRAAGHKNRPKSGANSMLRICHLNELLKLQNSPKLDAEYLMLQSHKTREQSQARHQQQAFHMASQRATETFEAAKSRRRAVAEMAAQRRQTFTSV
ncbi:unnamed protein product [Parnassius apollo]|uniref:(apollo) hypothetical protein n=1 Tax=Parnassius apollo TaxID=110799 RepID=A0A8S3W3P6_PARAO|nr:unnamed protein product [Parnassius apollo]